MKKVYLEYNPFLVETKITVDGDPVSSGGKLESKRNARLQSWLDILLPELENVECNDDISLQFKGTELDFNDVCAAIDDYKNRGGIMKVKLEDPIIVRGGKERLRMLKDLFAELQRDCPFDDLKSVDIRKNFERAVSAEFEVSVIATMSSGKSTLINALLGLELVPSKNQACTATIAHIKDNDDMKNFTAECRDADGKVVARSNNLTAEEMSRYNETERITDIFVEGDIPFVASSDMQLVLLDTPGPNNSRTNEHRKRTYRVIKDDKMPMVLYIMNATQLFTNDDESLINAVATAIKEQHGKQARDRFIFVINKSDQLNPDRGDSVEGAIKDAKAYLREKGIEDANIYPVSAEFAKLIRIKTAGKELSRRQLMDLNNAPLIFNDDQLMHLETYAPSSIPVGQVVGKQLSEATNVGDDYGMALVHTGIPSVEQAIVEYMEKYALCSKIKDAVDTFKSKIDEKDIMGRLERDWVANDEERQRVSRLWTQLSAQLAQGKQAQEFRQKIEAFNVENDVKQKRRQLVSKCDSMFDDKFFNRYDENENLDPDDMRYTLNEMKRMIQPLQNDLQTDLEKVVNDAVIKSAQKILDAYRAQIEELMQDAQLASPGFNFNVTTTILTAEVPSVEGMIGDYSKDILKSEKVGTTTVSDSTWYKPWTWFDEHEEPVFADKIYTVVDARELINAYFAPLRQNMNDNIVKICDATIRQSEDFKKYFIDELAKMDRFIQQKAQEIAEAAGNKQALAAKVKADEQKIRWLEEFQKKLDAAVKI